MGDQRKEKKLEKKFREIAKNKFLSPDNCTHLYQTRSYIYELNRIMKVSSITYHHLRNCCSTNTTPSRSACFMKDTKQII